MARTVSDFLVERLRAWGVRRIFGYPGDGINGVGEGHGARDFTWSGLLVDMAA